MTAIWRLRAGLLTLAGALLVHQARYALAPREHDHELVAAHQYLAWLIPLAAALLFVAVVQFAVWTRRTPGAGPPELPSAGGLWVGASTCLLTVFGVQETLELTAAHGQLPAFTEFLAHLGWQVLPLALLVGGVLALLLKGAAHVARWTGRHCHESAQRARAFALPPAPILSPRASVLARFLAGRAPPSLS